MHKKFVLILCLYIYVSSIAYNQSNDSINFYIKNAYLQLKNLAIYGRNEWVFGDVYSDDSQAGGDIGGNDLPPVQEISRFEPNVCNYIISDYWRANYQCINYANTGILLINNSEEDIDYSLLGHLRFFRALCYFNLYKLFGPVPVDEYPFNPDSILIGREAVGSSYLWDLIKEDLTISSSLLPKTSKIDDKYHLTQGAAKTLLIKVYIFQENWAVALDSAESIINSGLYSLEENYKDNFNILKENGKESIFEIEQVNDPPIEELPWVTNSHNVYMNPRKVIVNGVTLTYDGWGFNCPTQNLLNEFEPGDIRLKYTIAQAGDKLPYSISGTDTTWAYFDFTASPTGIYSRKYEIYPYEHSGSGNTLSLNIKVMRYAEVLLWAAEAAFHTDNNIKALEYINQVRARANLANLSGPVTLADIMHERRVELALEGHRFFDLQRYNIAGYLNMADVIQNCNKPGAGSFTENKNEILPIPAIVRAVYPNIEQNLNYSANFSIYKKGSTIRVNAKSVDSFLLSDYFGCNDSNEPDISLSDYSKNVISNVALSAGQMNVTYVTKKTGSDYINLNVNCGCSLTRTLNFEIVPNAPKSLIADAGNNSVILSWNKTNEYYFHNYRIYGGPGTNIYLIDSTEADNTDTVRTITNLTNDLVYNFKVSAVTDQYPTFPNTPLYESDFSNTVTFTPAKLAINGVSNVCPGNLVPLTVVKPRPSAAYFWYEEDRVLNETSINEVPVNLFVKSYTVRDINNNEVSDPVKIAWKTLPDDTIPKTYIGGGPEVFYLATDAKNVTYQWYYNNEPIQGANKYYYVANKSFGNYYVETKQTGRDCSAFSKIEMIDLNSGGGIISGLAENNVAAFPNPAQNELHIIVNDDFTGDVFLKVIDITGKPVYNTTTYKTDLSISIDIPLNKLNTGYYILDIESSTNHKIKFLKKE